MISTFTSIIKTFAYLSIAGITLWLLNDLWVVLLALAVGLCLGAGIFRFPTSRKK